VTSHSPTNRSSPTGVAPAICATVTGGVKSFMLPAAFVVSWNDRLVARTMTADHETDDTS
jgi:hypothetical protein